MDSYENLRSGAAVRKKDMFEEYRKETETPGKTACSFRGTMLKWTRFDKEKGCEDASRQVVGLQRGCVRR